MVEVKTKPKKNLEESNTETGPKPKAGLPEMTLPSPVADDPIVFLGLDEKKPVKVQERVTLNEAEVKKLDAWLEQIEKRFEGFIKLNKSELVSFIIRRHQDLLSREELEKIKFENYDEAKFLRWAVQRLEDAKKKGEPLKLADLFNAYRTVLDKSAVGAEKKAKDKNIKPLEPAVVEANSNKIPL